MVSEQVRSDVNYVVYAFNTLNVQDIQFNIPSGSVEDIEEVLLEDFGVESRKIEYNTKKSKNEQKL